MPPLQARVDGLRRQAPAYLVQEYLHNEWHPLWFSQVADELSGAKLRHVGSATLPENYLPGLLSAELAAVVRDHDSGGALQQELIDLAINQRSAEHTSELQSLMRISYAVFCLKKKKQHIHQ